MVWSKVTERWWQFMKKVQDQWDKLAHRPLPGAAPPSDSMTTGVDQDGGILALPIQVPKLVSPNLCRPFVRI